MVGVESGSQEMLDRLQKDMKLEQVRVTADMCARHGVGAIFNFIVGFPGESEQSMRGDARAREAAAAMEPGVRDADLLLPAVSRQSDRRAVAPSAATCFPQGLEEWADFDYVGGRGPWISADAVAAASSASSSTRGTRGSPGAWRWPLRAASRGAASTTGTRFPVEKALVELVRPPQQVS